MTSDSSIRKYRRPFSNTEISNTEKTNGTPTVIAVGSIDYTVFLVTILLLMVGVVMVFSASYYNAATKEIFNYDMFYFLKKQAAFAIMGFCIMVGVSNVNYRYFMKLSLPIYITANILLVYVTLKGAIYKGASRWIELGPISFQPSEVAKVGVILYVSYLIYKNKNILNSWLGFIIVSAVVGLTAFLVMIENFSTAIIIGIIGFGIMFVASPHIWRFIVAGVTALASVVFYLVFAGDFRAERFDAWLDPFAYAQGTGYQIVQSLYAIGSGGLFGLGIGQSRQKSFIPEPHNDFIFSIICEELGLIGAGLVLMLFGILIWRGIKIAINATDVFGSLVATGIVLMIASQTIINVAVATNTIPNTGVPIPLISAGGTSLLITMFLIGVLLNISRFSKE